MPGLFIDVRVDPEVARDPELAAKLAEVCPVNIFAVEAGRLKIVEQELDECVLCDLCLEAAPDGKLEILKLYEREA
jgi:NAD-dependent dihydropyrimidine dehydrogenase PreA subunit